MRATATDRAELRKMAESLPQLQRSNPDGTPRFKWQSVHGSYLLAIDPNATDKSGAAISANKVYYRQQPVLVDHYQCLALAFEKGGMEQARHYAKEANDFVARSKRPRPWWQRSFYTICMLLGIETKGMAEAKEQLQLLTPKTEQ